MNTRALLDGGAGECQSRPHRIVQERAAQSDGAGRLGAQVEPGGCRSDPRGIETRGLAGGLLLFRGARLLRLARVGCDEIFKAQLKAAGK